MVRCSLGCFHTNRLECKNMAVKKDKREAPLQEIKLDPAVQAYMSQGEQAEMDAQREKEVSLTAAQRRKRKKDAKRTRAIYDLPPLITNQIDAIAEDEGIPKSQLVAFLLHHALQDFAAGEIDLSPYKRFSRVPRFEWMLDLPDQN